jgi:hypothetical protein
LLACQKVRERGVAALVEAAETGAGWQARDWIDAGAMEVRLLGFPSRIMIR